MKIPNSIAAAAVLTTVSLAALSQGPPATRGNVGLYQRQPPTPTGPAPMLADGTPDLSGVWLGGGSNDSDIARGLKAGSSVAMLPWAEQLVKTRQSKDDPEANCLPPG